MNKQPEITDTTRRTIMDAFWELYKTTKIQEIKISAISEQAQVHRSTFYRYFNDIYDLLNQLEEEELLKISEDVQKALGTQVPLDLHKSATIFPEMLTHHAEKVYYLIRPQGDPEFLSRLRKLLKPFVMAQLTQTQSSLEKEYLFTFTFNLMLTNFNFWFEHQDAYTLKVITELSQQIVGNGLITFLKVAK